MATKDELKNKLDSAISEIDNAQPPVKQPEAQPVEPPVEPEPTAPEAAEVSEPITPEQPEAQPVEPPVEPKEDTIDYKKKFIESSRENQVAGFKSKAINEAFEKANELTPADDETMRKQFPTWDEMDPVLQGIVRDNDLNKRRFALVDSATKKFKEVENWQGELSSFIEDPKTLIKYPELEGKQDDFRDFAQKPTRRGVDFDDLVLAFNGERAKNPPVKHTGSMFPTPQGGRDKAPPKPQELMTVDQAIALRKSDYKEFVRLAREGKIPILPGE